MYVVSQKNRKEINIKISTADMTNECETDKIQHDRIPKDNWFILCGKHGKSKRFYMYSSQFHMNSGDKILFFLHFT